MNIALRNENEYERSLSAARVHLGERAFAAAWSQGQAMTPEQALAARGHKPTTRSTEAAPSPTYPDGLTAREVEVLRLAASGTLMTDATVSMFDQWQRFAEREQPLDVAAEMVEPVPELDGIPGIGVLETGEPDPTPGFTPLQEVGEGPVQPFEDGINTTAGRSRCSLPLSLKRRGLLRVKALSCKEVSTMLGISCQSSNHRHDLKPC